jgi:iron(III) transport system substrate-binding protein
MPNISRRTLLLLSAPLGAVASLRRAHAAADSLTLYNGQHRATTDALADAFTRESGVRVVMRNAESPELASQIMEEGADSPADLFYSEQSPPIAALAARGLLAAIDPATLGRIPARYSARDGTWIGATVRTRVVTYNRSMVGADGLPKSIMDFATPALAGRFAYVKQDGFQEQIMAIVHIKGRAAALAWLKGLKQYGRSYNSNRAASNAVEAGEIAMALSNNYYWYSLAQEVGEGRLHSALYSFPGDDPGNIFCVSAAGLLRSSRKAALAQRFLAFMVSPPGQQAMVATTAEYPVLAGVRSPFPLPPLERFSAPVSPADLGAATEAYALEREAGLI